MQEIVISDLLECPFCESEDLQYVAKVSFDENKKQINKWYVECKSCSARGGLENSKFEAKERWNRNYDYFVERDDTYLFNVKYIAWHTQAKDGGVESQVDFEAKNMQEARTWVQNNLDMSYEWTIREL